MGEMSGSDRAKKMTATLNRDCQIYERHILQEETQELLAAEFGVTQQRADRMKYRTEFPSSKIPIQSG
jgi:hypothetical protein